MSNITNFIEALAAADNTLKIVTDDAACASYVADNRSRVPANAPKAIVYPTSSNQVGKIIELANEYRTALVVRSSQGDTTYTGSSVPAEGVDAVAVNLSEMTKIMRIDTRNNIAIIEAGVTYKQLNEALKEKGCYIEHPLMVRGDKSVVASLLDREPVMTPKHCWDIPDPLACIELYMGNGSIFRTGSAAGPGTLEEMLASGCAINQPQGPYTLDLIRVMSGAQGTLAIATWASVKIRPIGTVCEVVYVQTDDIDALTAYEEQIVRRRLGENTFIVNKTAFAQITGLDAELKKWIMVTDVRGNRYFPERYVADQIADMEDLAKEAGLELVKEIPGVCSRTVQACIDSTGEQDGYWKARKGEALDQFFLSTLDRVSIYTRIAEKAVEKCGLNANDISVYIQPCMMGRNCHIEFLVPADEDKAAALEQMLGTCMLDNKAFFSRPYGSMTEKIFAKSATQTPFMKHIKEFFDENHIMNPGKLFA